MSPMEQVYLIGAIAAFVVFAVAIAFCRFNSAEAPQDQAPATLSRAGGAIRHG